VDICGVRWSTVLFLNALKMFRFFFLLFITFLRKMIEMPSQFDVGTCHVVEHLTKKRQISIKFDGIRLNALGSFITRLRIFQQIRSTSKSKTNSKALVVRCILYSTPIFVRTSAQVRERMQYSTFLVMSFTVRKTTNNGVHEKQKSGIGRRELIIKNCIIEFVL